MIKLESLNKYYKQGETSFHALKDVSLEIAEGEFVAVLGRSGSGKSTLLNIIGLIDSFDSGEYRFSDTDISALDNKKISRFRNENIGFVVQDYALLNQRSVLFNVMLPLYFSKIPYKNMKKKALEALKLLEIEDYASKTVSRLSGGQRQRVAIARAIVNSPKLILADEPTGALDSETADNIMKLLTRINETGVTVVVVTHEKHVASFCKREINVSDGEIT